MLVTRLATTEAHHDEDLIDARRYKAKVEKITAELVEVEAQISEGVQAATVSPIFGEADPGAAFLAAPIDVPRAVLRAVLRVEAPRCTEARLGPAERLRLSPVA